MMHNLINDIRNRMSTLRRVETRVQTPGGFVFHENRTEQGGFAGVEIPQPRIARCPGFVYDFKPDLQMAEVLPGLFLGSQDVASEKDLLKSKGVTHVINAASGIKNYFPEDFLYKRLVILDVPEQDIRSVFESCNEFIDDALHSNGAVYVHCNAGRKKMRLSNALDVVRKIRPIVRPNDGFMTQLEMFENETLGIS